MTDHEPGTVPDAGERRHALLVGLTSSVCPRPGMRVLLRCGLRQGVEVRGLVRSRSRAQDERWQVEDVRLDEGSVPWESSCADCGASTDGRTLHVRGHASKEIAVVVHYVGSPVSTDVPILERPYVLVGALVDAASAGLSMDDLVGEREVVVLQEGLATVS